MRLWDSLMTFLGSAWKNHEIHYAKQKIKDLKQGIHRDNSSDQYSFRMVDGQEQATLLQQAQEELDNLTHG